jgi:hypothetical protein
MEGRKYCGKHGVYNVGVCPWCRIDELERQRTSLRDVVSELADDVEAYANVERSSRNTYPHIHAKWEQDMAPVWRARRLLGGGEMKTYVTFGHGHRHEINGEVFDKDCVAVVNGDRNTVFEIFGAKFCFEYPENRWDASKMHYYPRGYIEVK